MPHTNNKDVPASQSKEWWAERNKRRRERYRKDKDYRKDIQDTNRDKYRAAHSVDVREVMPDGALLSLTTARKLIDEDGNPKKGKCNTFSVEEIAHALGGYHKVVLYRWIREGKFPAPNRLAIMSESRRTRIGVYTLKEARALLKIFRELQQKKTYFYTKDFATIAKLFSAMKQKVPV